MRRFVPLRVLAAFFLTLASTACENASSQSATNVNTATNSNDNSTFKELWTAYPKSGEPNVIGDSSNYYSLEGLKGDYKDANVVAYIDSKEVLSVGRSDYETDCINFSTNTGPGYCSFTMRAEILELYKGKIKSKTIEYSEYGEGRLIRNKEQFLGEQVVFLEKFRENGKVWYQVIENSTRDLEHNVLEKMRKISKFKR